jgi:hypothetical protein
MPTKRDVRAKLSPDELLAAADQFELSVADRRVKDQFDEAVSSSKKAGIVDVSARLSRDRLKEVCPGGLGFHDAEKKKAVLVDWQESGSAYIASARASSTAAPRPSPLHPVDEVDHSPTDLLTINGLERYLC